jgi:hypothetical protein
MTIDHDPHFETEALRIPAMIFPFHFAPARDVLLDSPTRSKGGRYYTAFANGGNRKQCTENFASDILLIDVRNFGATFDCPH